MAYDAVRSKAVVLMLFTDVPFVGICNYSMFFVRYFTSVNTSFAIISMGKRELDALIYNV